MSNEDKDKRLIPQLDGRALDVIKIMAALFMVIDHIDANLFARTMENMWWIGRATFPLFAYAVAVSVLKAGPVKAPQYTLRTYGARLLIAAMIVEPICRLTRDVPELNVLFTLGLGAIFAGMAYKMKDRAIYLCHVVAAFSIFIPSIVEFGLSGIVFPSAILMVMRGRKNAWPFLILLTWTLNMSGILSEPITPGIDTSAVILVSFLAFAGAALLPLATLRIGMEIKSAKRILPKYALHIFYPAHLILIWAYGHFIMGLS